MYLCRILPTLVLIRMTNTLVDTRTTVSSKATATADTTTPTGTSSSSLSSSSLLLASPKELQNSLTKHLITTTNHIQNLQRKIENYDDTTRRRLFTNQNDNPMFDFCDLIESFLGDDFIIGPKDGRCECDGTIASTLSLQCEFENICDELDILCASIHINLTIANYDNNDTDETYIASEEDDRFPSSLWLWRSNPTVTIKSCATMNIDLVREICIALDFVPPNFFLPNNCIVTYGDQVCTCNINTDVPCFEFDCSNATLPIDHNVRIMTDRCQIVSLKGRYANVKMFLPRIKYLPPEPGMSSSSSLYQEVDHDQEGNVVVEEGFNHHNVNTDDLITERSNYNQNDEYMAFNNDLAMSEDDKVADTNGDTNGDSSMEASSPSSHAINESVHALTSGDSSSGSSNSLGVAIILCMIGILV